MECLRFDDALHFAQQWNSGREFVIGNLDSQKCFEFSSTCRVLGAVDVQNVAELGMHTFGKEQSDVHPFESAVNSQP